MPQQQEVKASLGCGTLILIAVIVMIFGGHKDHDQLINQVEEIRLEGQRQHQDLSSKIRSLTDEVEALKKELKNKALTPERPE